MSPAEKPFVGLLGGTFDPPHLGHLILAQAACESLNLERVVFIPALIQPHKQDRPVTPANLRLEMLRLAVNGDPRFAVSEMEIARGGVSYTIDTIRGMELEYPESDLYLIIGADNVADIDTWKDPEEIFTRCRVAAANRKGYRLTGRFADRIRMFDIPEIDISSSEIRNRLKIGRSIRYLVPAPVEEFIKARGLYIK